MKCCNKEVKCNALYLEDAVNTQCREASLTTVVAGGSQLDYKTFIFNPFSRHQMFSIVTLERNPEYKNIFLTETSNAAAGEQNEVLGI